VLRKLAIIASIIVALPTLAVAQQYGGQHRPPPGKGPPGKPAIVRPPVGRPGFVPGRPVGPVVGGPRGPGRQFSFHGHFFNPVHLAPFVYPPGWAYRRWAVGAVLPPLFLVPAYYYADWATLGLTAPPPGFQWVRYGPDLLLVNVTNGQVVDVAYGVFY
jgi:hypothetical protein